eukprot:TRINITY_DN14945_c0_g1_i9.p1 TRINITY_DN14945_c0_g1~~TRINITY_DN14945_c0_g1_i9.p1  ORF type:complete len:292 (-),score=83.79 TRINITY_DN14945_c0_g1_i9:338-1213(-)
MRVSGDASIPLALIAILMALIAPTAEAFVPHPVCKVNGNDNFELKGLRRGEEDQPYYAVSPGGHYHYYFNFCGHAMGCYQQPACQVRLETDSAGKAKEDIKTVTTIGELYLMDWEEMGDEDIDMINAHLKKENVDKDDYTSGVKVTYAIGPKHRKAVIRVPCDPDATPEVSGLKSPATVVEDPILTYNIIFPSSEACELSLSQRKIAIPSMSHVVHSKTHFYSLLFVFVLVLYCCVGCWYKREKLGAQGMEAIPYYDTITACVDGIKGAGSGDSAVGGLLNRARGVSDDGL